MPSGNVSITPFDSDQTVNGVTYDTDYVLFEKKQTRSGDETLDSLYVVEQHVFVKRVTIVSVDSDKQFPYSGYNVSGDPYGGLISKETLYYRDEVVYATVDFSDSEEDTAGIQTGGYRIFSVHNSDDAKKKAEYVFTDKDAVYQHYTGGSSASTYNFWGIDPNGVMREGKQLSDNWYALSERQVIRKDSDGLVAEYFTNQNMGWPAVFSNLYATVWNRRDGGKHTNVYPVYKREAYNGPTKPRCRFTGRKLPLQWGHLPPTRTPN